MNMTPLTATTLAALLLAVAAAPAAAAAQPITVVERNVDVNPDQTNPCNGETVTVIDAEQDVFHLTQLPTGALKLSVHSTASVSVVPDDPTGASYRGRETYNFTTASNARTVATTTSWHLRLNGSDGSHITLREVAHITATRAGAAVAFDRPAMTCT